MVRTHIIFITLCTAHVILCSPPPLPNCGASCYINSIIQALYATQLTPKLSYRYEQLNRNPYDIPQPDIDTKVAQTYFDLIQQFPSCDTTSIRPFLESFVEQVSSVMEKLAPAEQKRASRQPMKPLISGTAPMRTRGRARITQRGPARPVKRVVPKEGQLSPQIVRQNIEENLKTLLSASYISQEELTAIKQLPLEQQSERILEIQITRVAKPFEQQDATEFLTYLLNALRSNNSDDLIDALFQLAIQKNIVCNGDIVASPHDVQFIFTVPVPGKSDKKPSLQDALSALFFPQEIQYKIQGQDADCMQYQFVQQSPEFLIIALNRFEITATGRIKKRDVLTVNDQIQLPGFNDIRFTYKLISVIKHIGISATGGHYIAYVQHNGIWYSCNDTTIQQTTTQHVLQDVKEDGYIFFYQSTASEPIMLPECPYLVPGMPVPAPEDPFVQDLRTLQEYLDQLLAHLIAAEE